MFSTIEGFAPKELASILGDRNIFTWDGHYYAVEIPEGASGPLVVSVFDGTHDDSNSVTGDAEGDAEFKLRFKLYPPDSTPGNWTDNKANNGGVAVCQKTFWEAGVHPTRSAAWGSTNGRT